MSEPKQYELSTQTIKDIIDKVPPERWNDCLEEMKVALAQVAAVFEAISVAAAGMKVILTGLFFGGQISLVATGRWC